MFFATTNNGNIKKIKKNDAIQLYFLSIDILLFWLVCCIRVIL